MTFDWRKVQWEAPSAMPGDRCSYCGAPIGEDDVPLILWMTETGLTARFCCECEGLVLPYALRLEGEEPCKPTSTTKH